MSVELVGARCIVRSFVAADAASVASVANERRIGLQLRDLFPHPHVNTVACPCSAQRFPGSSVAVEVVIPGRSNRLHNRCLE